MLPRRYWPPLLTRIAGEIENAVRDLRTLAEEARALPRTQCPAPVGTLADQIEGIASRRGLQTELHVFEGHVGQRDVWIFELTVFTPDPSEQKKLRNWR
ncbi:hypothetical protein [Pendulispora albinea]|uniref:Uncharacterized protein n=1 Tax=Pendulispora albinea TaxID=2741071 RepID=A0ABZ2MC65_9BACT